jgi:hypothetical protein
LLLQKSKNDKAPVKSIASFFHKQGPSAVTPDTNSEEAVEILDKSSTQDPNPLSATVCLKPIAESTPVSVAVITPACKSIFSDACAARHARNIMPSKTFRSAAGIKSC